jgi:flagellar L-ring protein FlgH
LKNLTILAAAALAAAACAQVDSEQNMGSLYRTNDRGLLSSRTAAVVGDVITILISEQSMSQFSANMANTTKDSSAVDRPKLPLIDMLGSTLLGRVLDNSNTGANASTSGVGSHGSTGRLSARMAAIVKEVLPNGNLVIEGIRFVQVNKDSQSLVLEGVIRRDDVRPDNTVFSENIAGAQIKLEGKGVTFERHRKGLLSRIMGWLF